MMEMSEMTCVHAPETVPRSGAKIHLPFVLISAVYVFCAIMRALHSALWMDELLTLEAATQQTWRAVVHVIWIGTDFSPPTYHLLLHIMPGLSSQPRLVARLPSIIAVFGAGLCMAAVVRRRYGTPVATIAFAATVASPLFVYAVEARQYGLTTLCLAAALALWDRIADSPRQRVMPLIGLWVALAACLCLHFYAIVALGALVLCEILWSAHARRVRVHVWAVFVALIPVLMAWLPLSIHLRAIGRADQVGPGFYGTPTLGRLARTIVDLAVGGPAQMPIYFGLVLAIVLGAMVRNEPGKCRSFSPTPDRNLVIIMLALAAIPFGAYALGIVATGSFVPRYAVGVTLLPGLMIAVAAATCPHPRRTATIILPLAALTLIAQSADTNRTGLMMQMRDILARHPGQPMLVGDGDLYIELIDFLEPLDAGRVRYLASPRDAANPDPTNEHELQRLASIDSRYHVVPFEQAVASPAGFEFLRTTNEADVAFPELLRRGGSIRLTAETELVEAFQIQPVSNGHQ